MRYKFKKKRQPIEQFYYFARIGPSLVAVWRVGGQETVQLIKGNITLERSYHGCCCLAAIKLTMANVAVETVTYRHFK